jgi:hypothetical protein
MIDRQKIYEKHEMIDTDMMMNHFISENHSEKQFVDTLLKSFMINWNW